MRKFLCVVAALFLLGTLAKCGSAYEPRLRRMDPQGGQRGTEIPVTLLGERLGEDSQEVLFYEPGIECKSLEGNGKNRAKAVFNILSDCKPGRHALRVRTLTGVSELMTFHIGVLEELTEVNPNDTLEQSQEVKLGITINGVIQREDVDCFAVSAEQGQRIAVEVEGLRLGRKFFDPRIELLDEQGVVVAECDDTPAAHQDSFLSFKAPKSGRYFVRLRESAYRGDDQCSYRLHIGSFPRPTSVFPPAAARGQEATLRWIGDAGGEHEQKVTLPAEGDTFDFWPQDDVGMAPSALQIKLVDTPPVVEVEPNNKRQAATPFSLPGSVVGVIQESGDRDYYRFESKKGQVWDFRVHGRRLRSPVDAVLRVLNEKGRGLAGNDDDRGFPDSYIRFRTPEDGIYVLQIDDRLKRGGAERSYLIEATAPRPEVDVKVEERRRYEATPIEVPRSGYAAVLMSVGRRDVGGDMELAFQGLPPGVTATVFPLAGNYNRVPVVFSATPDAPLASALTPIDVKLADKSRAVTTKFTQQTWHARGRNNRPMWSHFAKRAPVVVTEKLPFRLKVQQPKAPLVRGGVKNLKVVAKRDEGFDKPIRIYTLYNSPGVSSNRSRSIVKGKSEAVIPATANGNARTGDWNMTIIGEVNSGGRVYTCTPFFTLNIAEPYFDMKVPTATAKQAEEVDVTLELTHRTPFEGEAKLKLVRLPHGVTAGEATVNKESSSATFKLKVAADARPGRHRGLGCQVTLAVNGEQVVYTQGYSEVRVDPRQAAPEATANTGKPKRRGDS